MHGATPSFARFSSRANRALRPTGAALLGLFLAGCGGSSADDTSPPKSIDPLGFPVDSLGPYNAGYRSFPTTYDDRTITVNVWYPTDANGGDTVSYLGLAPDPLSFGNAPPARPVHASGYPVHAHSHGHLGFGGTSADLMRWFASHGWVAVAPDHIDNLLVDNPDDEPPHFDALRPLDVIAAVDAIAALPPEDPLSDAVTDRYILSGHSRGCTTNWSLLGAPVDTAARCEGCDSSQLALFDNLTDPRIVAAIPMAGTYSESTFTGFSQVETPVLSLTGSNDNAQSAAEQYTLLQELDLTWVELEGGCHQTFALGVCDTLDVDDGFRIVNTYSLAFARAHLLDDTDPYTLGLLDGSVELDSRARLLK